jgi:hypothetical protein
VGLLLDRKVAEERPLRGRHQCIQDSLSIGGGFSGCWRAQDRGLRAEEREIWGLLRDLGVLRDEGSGGSRPLPTFLPREAAVFESCLNLSFFANSDSKFSHQQCYTSILCK